ncbi:chemotaxis protein CheV [endosymbiont of unidentified scaly snail isolate Monju]|uniref:chemotaxis protein CheV n=1 Tax=endosymbiont of unidentified scaly snail isolate Monju TaxID=1248727 RepID=UPI0003892A95|nr:chemotaxis protein CheV [endosymbiont of unidentified scaly snail isolate Monju]BAN68561.1 two-component system, chemotaxis family, response regulator CheV [endosymbiont of unidentified scaly snail isolate Monju]
MAGILDGVDLRTQLAGHNRLELLLFRLGGKQRYGINVFKVQEVIHCPPLTRVPQAHPVVKGIANMRGKTITIMDLSMAIGGPPLEDYENKFTVITEYNRRVQGFLVDSVDRIINMNWQDILPPPRGAAEGTYMTAVTQMDGELVEIIDVEKVLKEVIGGQEDVSEGVIEERTDEQPHHVLVVDDSSVARNQVTRVLKRMGVDFTACKDGQEAWEQLQSWLDDERNVEDFLSLVISDVEMPRMDGYSLTKKIREHPALEKLHVILHTSLSGVFNKTMVAKVGANDFLPKWEPDTLAMIVQEQLRQHDQARADAA